MKLLFLFVVIPLLYFSVLLYLSRPFFLLLYYPVYRLKNLLELPARYQMLLLLHLMAAENCAAMFGNGPEVPIYPIPIIRD